MSFIVRELQKDSISKDSSVSELLRKAFLVATKLKQADFINWLNFEMNGYPIGNQDNYPPYRRLRGIVKVFNPYHGHQQVMFESHETGEAFSQRYCHQSATEIEHILEKSEPGGHFEMPFSDQVAKDMMDAIDFDLRPSLHVDSSSLYKILDSIRNMILKWSLQLEEDGILGESLSFSNEDRKTVESSNYNINNFFGNVTESQIQQGTKSSSQGYKK